MILTICSSKWSVISVPTSLKESLLAYSSTLSPRSTYSTANLAFPFGFHTSNWNATCPKQNPLSFLSCLSVSVPVSPVPVNSITIRPVAQAKYTGFILHSLHTPYSVTCQLLSILLSKYFSPYSLSRPTVTSCLEYYKSFLSGLPASSIVSFQIPLQSAGRAILKWKYDAVRPILKTLQPIAVALRVKFKILQGFSGSVPSLSTLPITLSSPVTC